MLLLVLAQGLQARQRQILLHYSLLDDFHLELDFIQLLGLLQVLLAPARHVLASGFAITRLLGILVSSGSRRLLLFQGFSRLQLCFLLFFEAMILLCLCFLLCLFLRLLLPRVLLRFLLLGQLLEAPRAAG